MDAKELKKLRRRLDRFVGKFSDCIKTAPSRRHLRTYVGGQVGDLERKNAEAIALAAGRFCGLVVLLVHTVNLHLDAVANPVI